MQIVLLLIAYDSARRMLLEGAREAKDAGKRSSELQVQESVPILGILGQ